MANSIKKRKKIKKTSLSSSPATSPSASSSPATSPSASSSPATSQQNENIVSASFKEIINVVTEYRKKIDELRKETEDKISLLDDSIKKIKEDTEKLSQRETKIVETLGIFFGLFAFISVSVQIYTRVTNLFSASIFTFLIFCLLTVIIVIFDILIRDKYKKESLVFGLSLIIILLGLSAIGIFTLKNVSLLPVENSKEFDRAVDLRLNDNYYNKNIVNKLINDNLKKILEQQKVVTQ